MLSLLMATTSSLLISLTGMFLPLKAKAVLRAITNIDAISVLGLDSQGHGPVNEVICRTKVLQIS